MEETKTQQMTSDNMPIRHTVKDSVFTDLFQEKKYLLELYQALHPEDTGIGEEAITNVTLKNIFTDGIHNDLGFMVRDRQIILVEAQSTWTVNIIVRALIYLVQTYQRNIAEKKMYLYGSKKIELPQPEMYVIYTGSGRGEKEVLSLKEEFFEGRDSALEMKVKVIYDSREGDIINQYITFTRIFNEQLKLYGETRKAIREAIRICKSRDVLKEYLESREQEVEGIMIDIFDDEFIMQTFIEDVKRRAAEEAEKATAEARRKAREATAEAREATAEAREATAEAREAKKEAKIEAEKTARETAFRLADMGCGAAMIAKALQVDIDIIHRWLENR